MRIALPALLLFVSSAMASAQAPDAKKDFEQKLKAENAKTAAAHVTLGKFCTGKKLHAAALVDYRRALWLDPNCTDAKRALLWKFEGGAWVVDPAAKVPDVNEGKPEAIDKALDEYALKRRAMMEKAAKAYSDLAESAAKKKLAEEAKAAWKLALFYDDSSDKAREGCGWVKDGTAWVCPADVEARAAEEKRIKAADAGKKVDDASDVEEKTGFRLAKRTSEHFQLEGMFTDGEMQTLVRTCEAARQAFFETFELPADALNFPVRGVFIKTKDDHKNFLVKFAGLSGRELDEENAMSGWSKYSPDTFEVRQGDRDFTLMPDWAVHNAIEFYWARQFSIPKCPAWLGDGIPYWFTYRMTKTALTSCVNFGTSAEGAESWEDVLDWRALTKDLVRSGHSPAIRDVLDGPLNSLDGPKGVKGWSLVDWMITTRKKEFFAFIKELADGAAQEDAVKKAFVVSGYAELDAQWAAYVMENY
ncbi:MAG: hypothetical protein K8T20_11255 [Planctomycetes bacterium]|nr:hypothetical protein [Planctomycetota bacterium]